MTCSALRLMLSVQTIWLSASNTSIPVLNFINGSLKFLLKVNELFKLDKSFINTTFL
jgi:hypothetical protein